jgi:hypothetical protein
MKNDKFERKWLRAFAKNVTDEQKEKAHIGIGGGFLWHAFSFECVPCFKGDAARAEYNKAKKNGAIEFFYDPACKIGLYEESEYLSATHMTAEQIDSDDLSEFYVIGKNYSWCYVRTHERDCCGPYFCYAIQPHSIP